MSKPLVSICIPNYNNSKYLALSIESALEQTYKNREIILVDDCSTDNSFEIAKKYEDKIKIFKNIKNLGQPLNTNKSVENSKGKYTVILHSDDILLPNFIETLIPILENHNNVGLAVGERMTTDETGRVKEIAPFYNTNCIIPGEKQAKIFMLTSFLPCQVLFRREIFDQVGCVDKHHIVNLDGLLWFKFALISDVGYIQSPVAIYRTHNENTTSQYNQSIDHMLEYYRTLSKMFTLAKDKPYLARFFDEAIKRVGALTLRYSHSIIRSSNFDLAKRYLTLALVFDPDLEQNHTYKTLKSCFESVDEDPLQLYKKLYDTVTPEIRTFSYDPPEGFIPLKGDFTKEI